MATLNVWRYNRATRDWTDNLYTDSEVEDFNDALAHMLLITSEASVTPKGKYLVEVVELGEGGEMGRYRAMHTNDELRGITSGV